jgi:hypothetical protein
VFFRFAEQRPVRELDFKEIYRRISLFSFLHKSPVSRYDVRLWIFLRFPLPETVTRNILLQVLELRIFSVNKFLKTVNWEPALIWLLTEIYYQSTAIHEKVRRKSWHCVRCVQSFDPEQDIKDFLDILWHSQKRKPNTKIWEGRRKIKVLVEEQLVLGELMFVANVLVVYNESNSQEFKTLLVSGIGLGVFSCGLESPIYPALAATLSASSNSLLLSSLSTVFEDQRFFWNYKVTVVLTYLVIAVANPVIGENNYTFSIVPKRVFWTVIEVTVYLGIFWSKGQSLVFIIIFIISYLWPNIFKSVSRGTMRVNLRANP